MNFYEVVENRKSIKRFKNTPIDGSKLDRMITAAMMSPSWRNNTSYKFILVDDKEKIEMLANTVINSTDDAADSLREAPLAAVVVSNPDSSGEVAQREYYLVDSAIALEHFVLAATAEGYGTSWIASIDEDKIRAILSIPREYRVVAMTPVGEIAEDRGHNPKKDINDYVFMNNWDNSYNKDLVLH